MRFRQQTEVSCILNHSRKRRPIADSVQMVRTFRRTGSSRSAFLRDRICQARARQALCVRWLWSGTRFRRPRLARSCCYRRSPGSLV